MYTLLVIALWFSDIDTIEPEVVHEEFNLSYEDCVFKGQDYPVPIEAAVTYLCLEDVDNYYEDFR